MNHLTPETKYYVRAYATTSSGIVYGEELDFTTETLPVETLTVYTNDIMEITTTTARCGGVVTANGDVEVTARGLCWSTSPNPTVSCAHSIDGQGLGAFSSLLTELEEGTLYYAKAYATTDSGDTFYGEEKSFMTESDGGSEGSVTVYTNEVTEISTTTAKCGGVVAANGNATITAKGVCWSITPNPNVSNSHTIEGQEMGAFTSSITDLSPNTTYYVRAYATSNCENIYGNEITFNTLPESPSEIEIIDVTYHSVRVSVSPSSNVAYYTSKVVGTDGITQHSISETELVFDNLLEQTEYMFEFSFYRSNGNLIDTESISVTTLEKPYEYAYVTVTATDIQPGYIEIQFEPSPNTAYYCFNQGSVLTSTYQNTGIITKKYNYLQPDTEYIFSVVAYDSNGIAGEITHPTFRTAPAPYSNYLRVANNFYEMNSAIIKATDYNTGWGMKMFIIRGIPIDTYWIRLEFECYSSELNLIWNPGTYTIGGNSPHHQYNCRFKRNAGSGNGILVTEGTFTISKDGNVYTIDIASEHDIVWAHFTGTASY